MDTKVLKEIRVILQKSKKSEDFSDKGRFEHPFAMSAGVRAAKTHNMGVDRLVAIIDDEIETT